jgi:hypothetical protein
MDDNDMKTPAKDALAFDFASFAAAVPGRTPGGKDFADCKERADDAIEVKAYASMAEMVYDL